MFVFVVGFAPFSRIGYFAIFDYIICKSSRVSAIANLQLFALYSNHWIVTTKTKIRLDTNHLNLMQIRFLNPKNLIRFDGFFFIWIENVNAVVRKNLIHFNSIRYNYDLRIRPNKDYVTIANFIWKNAKFKHWIITFGNDFPNLPTAAGINPRVTNYLGLLAVSTDYLQSIFLKIYFHQKKLRVQGSAVGV